MTNRTPKWRKATLQPCSTCGAWTIQGFDADTAALWTILDTNPITETDEPHLHHAGLSTAAVYHHAIHRRFIPGRAPPAAQLHVEHRHHNQHR